MDNNCTHEVFEYTATEDTTFSTYICSKCGEVIKEPEDSGTGA